MEHWKAIKGYEGYEVSNLGKVRSPRIILKGSLQGKGYVRVDLPKERKSKHISVHRLVAEAFIPNPLKKDQVNHINGIKTDNRLENLEWVTCKENHAHYHRLSVVNKKNPRQYKGESFIEIGKRLGKKTVVNVRIRHGWTVKEACETPIRKFKTPPGPRAIINHKKLK
jgi:hypothetical protein